VNTFAKPEFNKYEICSMSKPSTSEETVRSSPRIRRREANLARITEAATQIVVNEGIDALSIKRVADDALYTPGALYRYFDSKDALLASVAVVLMNNVKERLLTVAAAADGNQLNSAVAQAIAYCNYSRNDPHGFALLAKLVSEPRQVLEDEEVAHAPFDAMFETLAPLADALDRAANEGILTPGEAVSRAVILFASIQGILMLRKQERFTGSLVQTDLFAKELVRTLLAGWGAAGGALDSAFIAAKKLQRALPKDQRG
jgi:AcrR family transcriptional regulator